MLKHFFLITKCFLTWYCCLCAYNFFFFIIDCCIFGLKLFLQKSQRLSRFVFFPNVLQFKAFRQRWHWIFGFPKQTLSNIFLLLVSTIKPEKVIFFIVVFLSVCQSLFLNFDFHACFGKGFKIFNKILKLTLLENRDEVLKFVKIDEEKIVSVNLSVFS